jgi:anaerobic selenocysteine-containing dehydrogenase
MEPTSDYPYVLITGRLLEHFNTGEMTRRSKKLMRVRNESYIEINTADAEKTTLSEDDIVRVTSPYGTVVLKLKISKAVPTGYLFAPIHFNKPNLNSLMSAVPLDPQARMPALKVVPVNIEPKAH